MMVFRAGGKYQHLLSRNQCACCSAEVQSVTSRVTAELSRRSFVVGIGATLAGLGLPDLARAQSAPSPQTPKQKTIFKNLRLFDGRTATLRGGVSVLVDGEKIIDVASGELKAPDGATVIDCGGRTMMPGMIDAHWHCMMASLPLTALLTADVGYIHLAASAEAEKTLMRGFTTVRDIGGPSFALKKVIDQGMISGPRIFPSGAMISQTGGHGDFRMTYEIPRTEMSPLSRGEVLGASRITDGPDAVRRATREQLLLGASQIKVHAGGGVASIYDPLDVTQFRPAELAAAVEAADDWGTYVATHVYTPVGIKRSIEAGVRSIEHGQLADESSAKLMADNGIWWSLQPFLDDVDAIPFAEGSASRAKQLQLFNGTDNAYKLAKRYKVKTAWGTDTLFDAKLAIRQGAQLSKLVRWYGPAEVLTMATSGNAELLALSGLRSPYDGKLGVIEKDAFADLLIVDGDPLASIALIDDPANNFKVIMKNGRVHKNTL
jgi:imidazolonepropionase-like amidohydrolase